MAYVSLLVSVESLKVVLSIFNLQVHSGWMSASVRPRGGYDLRGSCLALKEQGAHLQNLQEPACGRTRPPAPKDGSPRSPRFPSACADPGPLEAIYARQTWTGCYLLGGFRLFGIDVPPPERLPVWYARAHLFVERPLLVASDWSGRWFGDPAT